MPNALYALHILYARYAVNMFDVVYKINLLNKTAKQNLSTNINFDEYVRPIQHI